MSINAPPQPPTAVANWDNPRSRVNSRAIKIGLGILVIAATCWFWTIHPIAGLAASFMAKHLLVALIAAGLSIPCEK